MSLAFPAAVASQSAQISGNVGARLSIGPVGEIVKSSTGVHVNKAAAVALAKRVQDMADAMGALLDDYVVLSSGKSTEALGLFEMVLKETQETLHEQGRKGYFAQLLHQRRDRESLNALAERLDHAFKVLMVNMRIQMADMATGLSSRLVGMLDNQPALGPQDLASKSQEHAAHIPPQPQLFFGRQDEMQALAHTLLAEPLGRVAILGGPGMGKTTLALAMLHHPTMAQRFGSRRFFVSCETSDSNLLAVISSAFGFTASDPGVLQVQIQKAIGSHSAVLVLDNFESVWEALGQRLHTEQVLQALDAIETLALVMTIRGTERPLGARWSRPFLPQLASISDTAAMQTFLAISDVDDEDGAASALLRYLDNVPLAVVLVANLAQYESVDALLERWQQHETAMLVRGDADNRLSSLDISIGLSVQSPRMQAAPSARGLLSILSVIPHGVSEADLRLFGNGNESCSLSVLLQTSLVTRADARVSVLAPIRSFMQSHFPPRQESMSPVYRHYYQMANLARASVASAFDAEAFTAVSAELANIDAVLDHALTHQHYSRAEAVKAVVDLCLMRRETGIGLGLNLLPRALAVTQELKLDSLQADLLLQWGLLSASYDVPGDATALVRGARELYERVSSMPGVIESSIYLTGCLSPEDAVDEARRLFSISEALNDRRSMARCASLLADGLQRQGRLLEAIEQHKLAVSILYDISEPGRPERLIGRSMCLMAAIYRHLGDVVQAARVYEDSLSVYELTHGTVGANFVRMQLADMFMFGRPREAAAYAAQALAQKTASNFRSYTACVLNLALANALAGDVAVATAAMECLAQVQPATGFSLLEQGYILQTQAYIALSRGDFAEARVLLGAARSTGRGTSTKMTTGVRTLEANNLQALSDVACAEGGRHDAVVFAICGAALFRSLQDSVSAVNCLVLLAFALDGDGAAPLLDAITLPLQRMGHDRGLAIALLRSAEIAQHRGKRDLANYRAENAVKHYGGSMDDRWRGIARRIQEEYEMTQ